MGTFDESKYKREGGYIFISHSHNDIAKVRKIRNFLEDNGFEPLCFYLKCMNDESEEGKEELKSLIKREIDAREWFIYANSENVKTSRWAQFEREYVNSLGNKKILNIDINDPNSVDRLLYTLYHKMRIFMSYSMSDAVLARRIKNKFAEKDYLTFFAEDDMKPGEFWANKFTNAITDAAQHGCFLLLLTPQAQKSKWVLNELEIAREKGGNIIPVMVGDVQLDDLFEFHLSRYQWYRISENPTDEEIELMVERIGEDILYEYKRGIGG